QQLDRARIAASSECGHPTGGINRHGAQKLGQLACCAGIEAAIGAMRQPSDLTEDLLDTSIVAFLEHEGGDAEPSKLAGFTGESIWVFLHGVADEHQGADP